MLLFVVSSFVFMNLCCPYVVVVMFWSVVVVRDVDEWMHLCADSKDVEICHVEDVELLHEWFGVCLWWLVHYDSDDLLLCSDEWL